MPRSKKKSERLPQDAKKKARKDSAAVRQVAARSTEDQLKHLDEQGFAAAKERKKLASRSAKKGPEAVQPPAEKPAKAVKKTKQAQP